MPNKGQGGWQAGAGGVGGARGEGMSKFQMQMKEAMDDQKEGTSDFIDRELKDAMAEID